MVVYCLKSMIQERNSVKCDIEKGCLTLYLRNGRDGEREGKKLHNSAMADANGTIR